MNFAWFIFYAWIGVAPALVYGSSVLNDWKALVFISVTAIIVGFCRLIDSFEKDDIR